MHMSEAIFEGVPPTEALVAKYAFLQKAGARSKQWWWWWL